MNKGRLRILVVETDCQLSKEMRRYFASQACWYSDAAGSIQELDSRFCHTAYDVVVTGTVLPDGSGHDVIRWASAALPEAFCVLVAGPTEAPLIQALPARGDFLLLEKPFKLSDLVLLISSATGSVPKVSNYPVLLKRQEGRWLLTVARSSGGAPLTETEGALVEILLEAPGIPVRREEIFRRIYRREMMPGDRSVDVYIGRLRKKLLELTRATYTIHNTRGRGYAITGSGG